MHRHSVRPGMANTLILVLFTASCASGQVTGNEQSVAVEDFVAKWRATSIESVAVNFSVEGFRHDDDLQRENRGDGLFLRQLNRGMLLQGYPKPYRVASVLDGTARSIGGKKKESKSSSPIYFATVKDEDGCVVKSHILTHFFLWWLQPLSTKDGTRLANLPVENLRAEKSGKGDTLVTVSPWPGHTLKLSKRYHWRPILERRIRGGKVTLEITYNYSIRNGALRLDRVQWDSDNKFTGTSSRTVEVSNIDFREVEESELRVVFPARTVVGDHRDGVDETLVVTDSGKLRHVGAAERSAAEGWNEILARDSYSAEAGQGMLSSASRIMLVLAVVVALAILIVWWIRKGVWSRVT